jgi:hypothetical protein
MPNDGGKRRKVKAPAQQADSAQEAEAAQHGDQYHEDHAQLGAKRGRGEKTGSASGRKKQKRQDLEQQNQHLKTQLQALEQQVQRQRGTHVADNALTMDELRHFFVNEQDIDVPAFDTSQTLPLQDWLTYVEVMEPNASDSKRIKSVLKKLKEHTILQRVLQAEQVPTTWQAFKQLLLGDQEDLLESVTSEWESIHQGERSVQQYYSHFQGALRRYQRVLAFVHPDVLLVSKFRKGLQPSLRSAVAPASCATVLDIMRAAKRVEADRILNQREPSHVMLGQPRMTPTQRDPSFRQAREQDVGDTPCPRHPRQPHAASQCFHKCDRHPTANHTKRNCPSARPSCMEFERGLCTYGNACRYAHNGRQSECDRRDFYATHRHS